MRPGHVLAYMTLQLPTWSAIDSVSGRDGGTVRPRALRCVREGLQFVVTAPENARGRTRSRRSCHREAVPCDHPVERDLALPELDTRSSSPTARARTRRRAALARSPPVRTRRRTSGTPSQSSWTSSSVSPAPSESMKRPRGRSHENTRPNVGACSARGTWLKTKNATTASNDERGSSIVVKSAWMNEASGRRSRAIESCAEDRSTPVYCRPSASLGDTVAGPHPSSSTSAPAGSRWSTSSRNHSRTPGSCDAVQSKYREPSRS